MGDPFGLLAGEGRLPLLVARSLKSKNHPVVAGFLSPDVCRGLRETVKVGQEFPLERFGEVSDFFLKNNVTNLVLAGSLERSLLYDEDRLKRADGIVKENLSRSNPNTDQDLVRRAIGILESNGLRVKGLDEVIGDKFAPSGHQAGPEASSEDIETLSYLIDVAITLADSGVGQTVIGKKDSIAAVEAAEGTDRTIRRAGQLAGDDLIMVKVARTCQDYRLDVPVVGDSTLKELADVNARLLAFEAGRMIWVQRDRCRSIAEAANLTLMGWDRKESQSDK